MNFQVLLVPFQALKRKVFLEMAVIFKMKKKNESKKASDARIFSQTRRKRPFKNLAIQIVDREACLVKI